MPRKKIENVSNLPFIAYSTNDPLIHYYLKRKFPRSRHAHIDIKCAANSHKAIVQLLLALPYYAVLPKLSIERERN